MGLAVGGTPASVGSAQGDPVAVEHRPEGQADKPHPHVRQEASAGRPATAIGTDRCRVKAVTRFISSHRIVTKSLWLSNT